MINYFYGKYRWLSNFYSVKIILDEIEYPSVEHAYQSSKSHEKRWKEICQDPLNTSGKIKQLASSEIIADVDFNKNKLEIMEYCLRQKFYYEFFKNKLLETGNQNIVEGNNWGDTFWGVDINKQPNYGENHLGRLIMKIRDELK